MLFFLSFASCLSLNIPHDLVFLSSPCCVVVLHSCLLLCVFQTDVFLSIRGKKTLKNIYLLSPHLSSCIALISRSLKSVYRLCSYQHFFPFIPLHPVPFFIFSTFPCLPALLPSWFSTSSAIPLFFFFVAHDWSALITLMARMIHLNGTISKAFLSFANRRAFSSGTTAGHLLLSGLTSQCHHAI